MSQEIMNRVQLTLHSGATARDMFYAHQIDVINRGERSYEFQQTLATTLESYIAVLNRYLCGERHVEYQDEHMRGEYLNFRAYFSLSNGVYGSMEASEFCIHTHISAPSEEEAREYYQCMRKYQIDDAKDDTEDDTAGQVFVLCVTLQGLKIQPIGYAEVPIDWDNYDPMVVEKIKIGIQDLNTDTPRGRMMILEGPPGTGKTYLIRGLVGEIKNAPFVIIPANAVAKLGDPQLMTFMLKFKEDNDFEGPLVLLIEDADQCLIKREHGELSGVSSVLNLSDGILGEMMDIRIIATTNAMTMDFDPAILRKGRLSTHAKVDKLGADQATRVLKRLVPGTHRTIKQPCKLTQVYDMAYELGWRPLSKSAREEQYQKRIDEIAARKAKPSVLKQYLAYKNGKSTQIEVRA